MEKCLFEKDFIDKLNHNFEKYSQYFNFDSSIFSDLTQQIFEINKCLMLELYHTSITSTNNLLERLLKLSLIYKESGTGPTDPEFLGDKFSNANKKYSSITFSQSLKYCLEFNLITDKEFDFFNNTVRECIRNGFSHADTNKILKNVPEKTPMFVGNFSNPGVMKPIELNTKDIPTFQTIIMNEFSKKNAYLYFHQVFSLIGRIEKRLISNH